MLISALEIISQSYSLYTKNWRKAIPFLAITLGTVIFFQICSYLAIKLEVHGWSTSIIDDIVLFIIFLAGAVVSFWSYIGLLKTFDSLYKAQDTTTTKETLSQSTNLIWPAFYTSLFAGLAIFIGVLLLIVPGIIFAIWFEFAFLAVVIDGIRGFKALKFSKTLVIGRWGAVAWRLIIPGLCFAIANFIIQLILVYILQLVLPAQNLGSDVIVSSVANIINLLFMPALLITVLVLYENLKANPAVNLAPPKQ